MGKTINTKIDDGLITFTFTNTSGEVFSSFRMNPTDIRLAERCESVAKYFSERKNTVQGESTAAEAAKYDRELEEQLNYLLGYDAAETLFRAPFTPTTIFPDGSIFAFVILNTIANAITPEIEKRKKKIASGIEKYAGKYL